MFTADGEVCCFDLSLLLPQVNQVLTDFYKRMEADESVEDSDEQESSSGLDSSIDDIVEQILGGKTNKGPSAEKQNSATDQNIEGINDTKSRIQKSQRSGAEPD